MTVLHTCPRVHAELKTCTVGTPTLYIGFRDATSRDFDRIRTLILKSNRKKRTDPFFLHLHHYDGNLLPPDLPCLTAIVTKLSDEKHLVKHKIMATCVQAKEASALVWAAKNLFLKLYQPVKPFTVVTDEEERNAFFRGVQS